MIRVSVFYPSSGPENFDAGYYFTNHYKLVCDRLKPEGMVSAQFDKGLAGGELKGTRLSTPSRIWCSIPCRSSRRRWASMAKEIMGDVANYTSIAPIIQVNEIAAG